MISTRNFEEVAKTEVETITQSIAIDGKNPDG
jgi:hypothetical protein